LDENDTLLVEHTSKEHKYEAELRDTADKEEARIMAQLAASRAYAVQRQAELLASRVRESQRREAIKRKKSYKKEAVERERNFWKGEMELLKIHLKTNQEDGEFERKLAELLSGMPAWVRSEKLSGLMSLSDDDDNTADALLDDSGSDGRDDSMRFDSETQELDRQRMKEMAKLEGMRKTNHESVVKMKKQHKLIRESRRTEHGKILKALKEAQVTEIAKLKEQQVKEMQSVEETQKTSDRLDEDNKMSNERLYALLPRFVADKLKSGDPIEPTPFKNLTFLIADIVSFTNLSSKSSAKQIVSLLNRLYSQMDETLDNFDDVYKLETIGDAYCIVAGINDQERSPKKNAKDIIEVAMNFIDIVQQLDMSDQVQEELQVRIGIHSGPAVGGVTNPSQPKFSLFGDTVTITGRIEQTSRPLEIHVSATTYEMVKDEFEFDVSESVALEAADGGSKKKISAYWLQGRKLAGGKGGNANEERAERVGGSRARFADQ
jgi:class 3 adenylate cyclase